MYLPIGLCISFHLYFPSKEIVMSNGVRTVIVKAKVFFVYKQLRFLNFTSMVIFGTMCSLFEATGYSTTETSSGTNSKRHFK